MMELSEHGDSVYMPSRNKPSRGALLGTRGPLGRWIRRGEPDYEEALNAQRKLEEEWVEARDELGDG